MSRGSRMAVPVAVMALLLAAPMALGAGRQLTLTGRVGGSYYHLLGGEVASPDVLDSLWGFYGNLALSGGFFNPHVFRWSASADYDGSRGLLSRANAAVDRLGFKLNGVLFGSSPLSLSFAAARRFHGLTLQDGPITSTGLSRSTSISGTAVFRQERLPTAFLTLGRELIDSEQTGGPPTFLYTTRLSTGVSQALPFFDYLINYDTSWNRGTYADLNYQAHNLRVNAAAPLSPTVKLYLNERYYLRLPTLDAATNPRYDSDDFDTGLQWRPDEKLTSWFGYNYSHNLITLPATPDRESRRHLLYTRNRYRLTDTLSLLGDVGALAALSRLGTVSEEGYEQRVTAGLEWTRPYAWGSALVMGSVSLGIVEPVTGGVWFSHGASAQGTFSRNWSRFGAALHYLVAYANQGAAQPGWSLTQQLRVEGNCQLADTIRLRALFLGHSGRRDDRLQGTFLNRSLSLLVELAAPRYSAQLQAGTGDGLGDALTNPVYSDGFFLPVAYNTHSRFLLFGGATSFDEGRLALQGNLRFTQTVAPGRPDQYEQGFSLLGSYTLGRFRFSLEERLTFGSFGTSRQVLNLLMLRLTRDFDWAF